MLINFLVFIALFGLARFLIGIGWEIVKVALEQVGISICDNKKDD